LTVEIKLTGKIVIDTNWQHRKFQIQKVNL